MRNSGASLLSFASAIAALGSAIAAENGAPIAYPDAVPPPKQHFRLPQSPLAPGVSPNVRCNNRVTCSSGRGTIQSETALAIIGDAVICGYNDFAGRTARTSFRDTNGWAGRTLSMEGPRSPTADPYRATPCTVATHGSQRDPPATEMR